MLRNDKQKVIEGLRDRIGRMTALVLTDYEGIDVEHMTVLRREFRRAGVEYTVVKNKLIQMALEGTPFAESLKPHLKGMTALALTYDDPSAPARVIREFRKTLQDKPAIKCGVVGAGPAQPGPGPRHAAQHHPGAGPQDPVCPAGSRAGRSGRDPGP
jgi:large subunit ribosomal protein L10